MNADKISAVKTASICMAATTVHVMKATCLEKMENLARVTILLKVHIDINTPTFSLHVIIYLIY